MDIQMRSLKTKDIFPMSVILKKIGLREIAKEAALKAAKEAESGNALTKRDVTLRAGVEMFAAVFENLHLAEKEVNALLADMCGMKPDEFAELDLDVVLTIMDKFKGNAAFANFLKQASR